MLGNLSDFNYTYGFYSALNPFRTKFRLIHAGIEPPNFSNACELGFGFGLNVALNSAGSSIRWYGTDFNANQAAFAQELTNVAGVDAKLFNEAFKDFMYRPDLPDFDFIGMHGLWSWVSDESRALVVDFLQRKLKAGGVAYISYNTSPRCGPMIPVRDLWIEHVRLLEAKTEAPTEKIINALNFFEKLLATNPAYVKACPDIVQRLAFIKSQNVNYVAHEYFAEAWHITYFSKIVADLEPAQLTYAYHENVVLTLDTLNLQQAQIDLLAQITDPVFRENVRDFMIDRQYRQDFWVKGVRRLTSHDRLARLRAQRVILVRDPARLSLYVNSTLGEVTLFEEVYRPILNMLSDYSVKTIGELEEKLCGEDLSFEALMLSLLVLMFKLAVFPAQDQQAIVNAKPCTDRLNKHLIQKALDDGKVEYLASPVTGSGIAVERYQQIFLLARLNGIHAPEQWARYATDELLARCQTIKTDDATLTDPQAMYTELLRQANEFANSRLRILQALQIA
ncbi:MAG TPA: class I SAM-dependent methyltransferase [Burkholderiaceae bacterium]|nr:class I SAM-dependent methyltransferase [Burkholderiaceae bacterium]